LVSHKFAKQIPGPDPPGGELDEREDGEGDIWSCQRKERYILPEFCLTFSNEKVRILQVRVRKETTDAYHLKGPGYHSDRSSGKNGTSSKYRGGVPDSGKYGQTEKEDRIFIKTIS
jgi:hypothetical protein